MTSVVVHGQDDISDKPNTDRQIEAAPRQSDSRIISICWGDGTRPAENEGLETGKTHVLRKAAPVHETPFRPAPVSGAAARGFPTLPDAQHAHTAGYHRREGPLGRGRGGRPFFRPAGAQRRNPWCRGGNRISLGPAEETTEELGKHVHRIDTTRTTHSSSPPTRSSGQSRRRSVLWISAPICAPLHVVLKLRSLDLDDTRDGQQPQVRFSSGTDPASSRASQRGLGRRRNTFVHCSQGQPGDVYQLGGRRTTIPVDIVPASPS